MTAADEPVAPIAVEHAAKAVDRSQRKWFLGSAAVTIASAATLPAIGITGIPIGILAFVIAGRAAGRRRRAAEIARATADPDRTWSVADRTVTGRHPDRRDLVLSLPPSVVRTLRALPPARVV